MDIRNSQVKKQMKTKYPISYSLHSFIHIFKGDLTKPRLNPFSSLIMANLHGHGRIRKIADLFSNRDQSSISRFLLSNAWDHEKINDIRISFANEIGKQKYKKYYSMIKIVLYYNTCILKIIRQTIKNDNIF